MSWLQPTPEGARVTVRVVPNSPRTAIAGVYGDALKVRLQAPPVDGKANQVLIEFLAETCQLPRSAVRLVAGSTSRNKKVLLAGTAAGAMQARLLGR